jgi:lipopolysaccharide export system protein LptC
MVTRRLTYSQTITWLKVLLPLFALALLSTMFLFARSVTPTSTIPFAKFELEERARDQQISAPFLTGQTTLGHNIRVTADAAKPDTNITALTVVEGLAAKIDYADGSFLEMRSQLGTIDSGNLYAELSGDVRIRASDNIEFQTQTLSLNLDQGTAITPSDVTGKGPFGSFQAGAMELRFDGEENSGRFLFTNGIKLVYIP